MTKSLIRDREEKRGYTDTLNKAKDIKKPHASTNSGAQGFLLSGVVKESFECCYWPWILLKNFVTVFKHPLALRFHLFVASGFPFLFIVLLE